MPLHLKHTRDWQVVVFFPCLSSICQADQRAALKLLAGEMEMNEKHLWCYNLGYIQLFEVVRVRVCMCACIVLYVPLCLWSYIWIKDTGFNRTWGLCVLEHTFPHTCKGPVNLKSSWVWIPLFDWNATHRHMAYTARESTHMILQFWLSVITMIIREGELEGVGFYIYITLASLGKWIQWCFW